MKRVAILISGTGSNMVALLDSMAEPDHPARPVCVLSNRPDARGIEKAAARDVTTQVVDHTAFSGNRAGFDAALSDALAQYSPDVICLAGFMRVLGAPFVEQWQGRILNIHPSLLPRHRGLNTHEKVLAAGDRVHGCTVHEVTADLDDGPILGQAELAVLPDDTAETLASRVLPLEHRLYATVLRRFVDGDMSRVHLT